jgi:predicted aspartyl protease
MKKAFVSLFILVTMLWAVSYARTAHDFFWQNEDGDVQGGQRPVTGTSILPGTVRLRENDARGLIANVWVNDRGPFALVIDTGAGQTLVSERVAQAAGLTARSGGSIRIAGLSGVASATGREATANKISIGGVENTLSSGIRVIITPNLPQDIDGVLDPAQAYWPLGFIIDMPRAEIRAFDPRRDPIRPSDAGPEGAVVSWLTDGSTRRPFVNLDNGRRALIDTGSSLGFAMSELTARQTGLLNIEPERDRHVRDIGGSRVTSRRVSPATIRIGTLTLGHVPTDILYGAETAAPIILGRDALKPFILAFDPRNRLISIVASESD